MARFIINEKVYDTAKMERIGKVIKAFPASEWEKQLFGPEACHRRECDLFRSAKGNWMLVYENDWSQKTGYAITESEARDLLMRSDYKTYVSMFGELEEA